MNASSPLLQRCFQEAASLSRQALDRCVDVAVAALQEAERNAAKLIERDALVLAWTSLLPLRAAWREAYPSALLASFSAASGAGAEKRAHAGSGAVASPMGGPDDFSNLSLVDDAQVSQSIEFARLSQQFQLQVEPVMADLDALISSAQGFANVRAERNPLRPEVFVGALRGLLDSATVAPQIRALWLKYLAAPMARDLRLIYEQIVALLLSAKVQAAGYRMVSNSAGVGAGSAVRGAGGARRTGQAGAVRQDRWQGHGGRHGGFEAGPDGEAPLADRADPFQPGVHQAYFHDFLLNGQEADRVRLADAYYARANEELQALRAVRESGPDAPESAAAPDDPAPQARGQSQGQRHVDGQSSLSRRVWGDYAGAKARGIVRSELRKEATYLRQVLGLEAVRQLVNQVALDPRLLLPVREAIVALEPSLMRLAMVDPRFFSEESHPGRRLMERAAQRSFKYHDERSAGFVAFFDSVRKTFNALNGQQIDSALPFSAALATLESAWLETDREEEVKRHELLQGLRFAEERQTLADQIAYDMSSRPDLEKVPGVVLDFLFGPWALAIAHARLVDQSSQLDPRGFRTVVSDLVWSVKQDFILRQPAKLMDLIPGMLRTLHAGLDLIGQEATEREAFFEILMRLHQPALKLRRRKSRHDAKESGAAPLESDLLAATDAQRVPAPASQPWLARSEQDHAGFEDTLPPAAAAEFADELAAAAESGSEPGQARRCDADPQYWTERERIEHLLNQLHTGCWVDLFSRRRWRRAQLAWASAKGTLFMFVSHGGRPHSMTRRSCERLISSQLLRLVDSNGVVAHALATLKQEARASALPPAPAPASETAPHPLADMHVA